MHFFILCLLMLNQTPRRMHRPDRPRQNWWGPRRSKSTSKPGEDWSRRLPNSKACSPHCRVPHSRAGKECSHLLHCLVFSNHLRGIATLRRCDRGLLASSRLWNEILEPALRAQCMHIYICVCMYVYVCVCMCMYIYMCVYVCVYIYIYTYIIIYNYRYIHMYLYIYNIWDDEPLRFSRIIIPERDPKQCCKEHDEEIPSASSVCASYGLKFWPITGWHQPSLFSLLTFQPFNQKHG